MKKDIKEEVLQEGRHEIEKNFESINQDYEEYIKKDYESKINIQISDDDNNDDMLDDNMLDIRGHGQQPKY